MQILEEVSVVSIASDTPNADEIINIVPVDEAKVDQVEQVVEIERTPQTELAYDMPPDDLPAEIVPEDWAHTVHMNDFLPDWNDFVESQSVRISSLLNLIKPEISGHEFILTVTGRAQLEGLDSIRFPLTRYINEKTNGKLTVVTIKLGEVQESASRPYTEKEKLDFLLKKKPILAEIIQKLELRIP